MTVDNRSFIRMVSHQPVHFIYSLFLALSTLCPTFGQSPTSSFIPTPASNPAFSRTITKLYIAGGNTPTDLSFATLRQFISLDLAIPWTRNAPAWTQLADGPAQAEFPAAFSSDEQTMFAFHIQGSNSPMQYNVQSNSWQKSVVRFQNAGTAGVGAVTDPRTGLIYLMGGYENKDPTSPWQQVLDIFDPVSQTIRAVHLPNRDIFSVPWYSGNVWSKHKNSILYWGGLNGTTYHTGAVTSRITELFPDSMTWSTLQVKGAAPEVKEYHCMAANEDGTKLAVYGGRYRNGTVVGELWVLDVVTSTWSQGQSGPPRAYAACTIAGDYFLIWGGGKFKIEAISSEMLIYNMNTSSYVQQYTPPAYYKDLKPPPPLTRTKALWATDSPELSGQSSDRPPVPVGVAVGGAVGGLVIVVVLAGSLLMLRRRKQRQSKDYREHKFTDSPGGFRGLLGLGRGRDGGERGSGKGPENNPQETNEDDELERAVDRLKELEDRQKKLDQKRQLFLEQQHDSHQKLLKIQKRGPTEFPDDKAEIISWPLPPPRPGPDAAFSVSYAPGILQDMRTVQAVTGPIDIYHGDSYVNDGQQKESELVQDLIEPMYESSPAVNNAIPDLVYIPPPNVGMDWTRRQQSNHPHTFIEPQHESTLY